MEPLIVDSTIEGQEKEETIWWTCQGARTKSCDFPLSMPSEVFWTKRNAQQIENDVIPLPNFHLLPTKFHHLYSAFYNPTQSAQGRFAGISSSCQTVKRTAEPSCFPQRPSKVIRNSVPASWAKKSATKRESSTKRCMELVDSHVRYFPTTEVISARLGKDYQSPQQKPTESNSIEWTEMNLNRGATRDNNNDSSNDQNSVNLPSCSSVSSNSLEQNLNSLPEGHPLHLQSLGDAELDNLVRENLSGILRSKKLNKRKRKLKIKSDEPIVPPFENFAPYAHPEHPEQPDEFEFNFDPCF